MQKGRIRNLNVMLNEGNKLNNKNDSEWAKWIQWGKYNKNAKKCYDMKYNKKC